VAIVFSTCIACAIVFIFSSGGRGIVFQRILNLFGV
jgi:ribosomal protein S27E